MSQQFGLHQLGSFLVLSGVTQAAGISWKIMWGAGWSRGLQLGWLAHFSSLLLRGLLGLLHMELSGEQEEESPNAQGLLNPLSASHLLMSQ